MVLDGDMFLFEHNFEAQSSELCKIREMVRHTAEESGCSVDCAELIVIAVNEACMNIIQHGYHSKPGGSIIVEIRKRGNSLIIRLRDFADSVDPSQVRSRDLGDIRPGGLGTHFIKEVMDEIEFLVPPNGIGNLLQMVKIIA
tara:strand:+ start:170 stop:595 length:426 start_codon:yes stop_codon:yes gene_type:complete